MKIIIPQQVKTVAVFLISAFIGVSLQAQDITGQWNSVLNVQGMNLRLVFHINQTGENYTATMDSPDQGAAGIPVDSALFADSKLSLTISKIGLSYKGEFKTDSIVGTFTQGILSVPMTLKRTPAEAEPVVGSQEPKPPYPYISEDITFENKSAGVTLAGTLTMPSSGSNFTAAILITGSGAQNRDEEIMGHKPFLVIADYLTQRGIAVLRYDDRGTAQSTGDFHSATTADFASDVESAIAYLKTRKEINQSKIGLIGHSEGGVIAPMVATRSNNVAFIVMLAGSGVRGDSLLLLQQRQIYSVSMPKDTVSRILKVNEKVFEKIVNSKENVSQQDIIDLMTLLKDNLVQVAPQGFNVDAYIQQFAAQVSTPWMQYFLCYDPKPALEKVKCPVLAINGSKDWQVIPQENLSAIYAALKKGGNEKITVKVYPGLNHLFQECITGSPVEYGAIRQTFSPEVLKDIADWIMNNQEL